MGFSVSQVRYEVARKIGAASGRPRRRRPAYSTRAEAMLSQALGEAHRHGRDVVQPEDLLVAIVTEPDGRAAGVLNRLRAEGAAGSEGRVPAAF
jgi:ATP-dependent Clp protease ATP-binding subunit ClpA